MGLKACYARVMQALHPLIQDSEHAATQDNAAGAVGRMLSSMPAHLPLDQVLPVLLSEHPKLLHTACLVLLICLFKFGP